MSAKRYYHRPPPKIEEVPLPAARPLPIPPQPATGATQAPDAAVSAPSTPMAPGPSTAAPHAAAPFTRLPPGVTEALTPPRIIRGAVGPDAAGAPIPTIYRRADRAGRMTANAASPGAAPADAPTPPGGAPTGPPGSSAVETRPPSAHPFAPSANEPVTRLPQTNVPIAGKAAPASPSPTPAGAPPAPKAPKGPPAPWDAENQPSKQAKVWVAVAFWLILAAALALRLREALSSPVIGAEDPYTHMERTWDLIQGQGIESYPPGLMLLLFPFALMGSDVFYMVARFAPSFLGVAMVAGVFLLCRSHMHPVGALTAAFFVAVTPEMIRRTDLLFPTAVDLAILPFLFIWVIRATTLERKALYMVAGGALLLFLIHPWVLGLLAPTLMVFAIILVLKSHSKYKYPAAGGAVAGAFLVVWTASSWSVPSMVMDHAWPRFKELLANPASIAPLPIYVDNLPAMVGWPLLVLGGAGIGVAALRRDRFSLLLMLWTLLLIPLVLVDWFDIWYVPHRTVAFLGLGLAVLAGLTVSMIMQSLPQGQAKQSAITVGVLGVALLAFAAPAAADMDPWYRLYDEEDYEAWEAIDARGTDYVVAASWQAQVGYRGVTGGSSDYNPGFFTDETTREFEMQENPGLVVLVDQYARDNGVILDFLDDDGWQQLGTWGNTTAYLSPS